MKNLLFLTLLLTMLFLGTVSVEAANRYVRAGASGSANGADWTNAYTTLPSVLTRGDTFYITDGTYTGRTFSTAVSGRTLITVKKATVKDHGTSTGWLDTYGDGQAIFNGMLQFLTSYWVIDGQVGGGPGSWTNGHGFKIVLTQTGASPDPGIFIGDASYNAQVGNITVSHVEVAGNLNSNGGGSHAQDGVTLHQANGPVTIRYFYFHELGRCPFALDIVQAFTAEYGYTGTYTATGAQHSEVISGSNIRGLLTFRYNIVAHVDNHSTGGLLLSMSDGGSADIYGNVFARPEGDAWAGSNGIIGGWTNYLVARVTVVNNSFVNINNVGSGTFANDGVLMDAAFVNVSSNNVVQNNLFYNVANPGGGIQWGTISHNHFISTLTIGIDTTTGSGNPFVNDVNLDFHLIVSTPAGVRLGTPYNIDMYGNVRGADGLWDRGAIEFDSRTDIAPTEPPANLQIR